MTTIIKRTPITAFGRDAMELLVLDPDVWGEECCEHCCYRGYTPSAPEYVPCCDVHGCGMSPYTYFLVEQL